MLVAIEGIDGTGKNTQVRLVSELLRAHSLAVETTGFPQYDATRSGEILKSYLAGSFGEVAPLFVSMLFAMDRFEAKGRLLQAMARSDVVMVDRYVSSNVAHQCARETEAGKRLFLSAWIRTLEYEIFGLPKPDVQILLVTTEAIAEQNRNTRGGEADLHERDKGHQTRALQAFLALANEPGWHKVQTHENGVQRAPGDIAREIVAIVMREKVFKSGIDRNATLQGVAIAIFGPNCLQSDADRVATRLAAAGRVLEYFRTIGSGNASTDTAF